LHLYKLVSKPASRFVKTDSFV